MWKSGDAVYGVVQRTRPFISQKDFCRCRGVVIFEGPSLEVSTGGTGEIQSWQTSEYTPRVVDTGNSIRMESRDEEAGHIRWHRPLRTCWRTERIINVREKLKRDISVYKSTCCFCRETDFGLSQLLFFGCDKTSQLRKLIKESP